MAQVEGVVALERAAGTVGTKHVEALARGLKILALFSDQEPWLGLSEIARRTGLSTATSLRLLRTLQHLDFVEQADDTKKYRPSVAVLHLGFAALSGLGLRDVAAPHLRRLFEELGETINLAVLAGTDVVYIERFAQRQIISTSLHVGACLPAYSTSTGKLLLAFLPVSERAATLDRIPFAVTGPNTIANRADLEAHLAGIVTDGFAIQDEELAAGLRSVAVPIWDGTGSIVAAMNVAVPASRISVHDLCERILPRARDCAAAISGVLGYSPSREAAPVASLPDRGESRAASG